MKNLTFLVLISAITLDNYGDAISVNQMSHQQMKSGASSTQRSRQKMGLNLRTGVKSNQQLLAEVMLQDDKAKKSSNEQKDQSLVAVDSSAFADAAILSGGDDDGGDAGPAELPPGMAALDQPEAGQAGDGASKGNSTEEGADQVEGDKKTAEANKLDDKYIDKTRNWMNKKYGIKDINETDPIYGHKVFKDAMKRFLPYNAKKPVNKRWTYGWYQMDDERDHSADWDKDLTKGGDKATEGYYPLDEEDEEKTWARRFGHYSNYGPWNYRWGQSFFNNGGYNGNPNWYGGYPQPYPYGPGNGYWGMVGNPWGANAQSNDADKECKRNPDGTCKADEGGDDKAAVQVEQQSMAQVPQAPLNPYKTEAQLEKTQADTTKFIKNESGVGPEGDIEADWF